MQVLLKMIFSFILLFHLPAFANPYWDPQRVPKDENYLSSSLKLPDSGKLRRVTNDAAIDALRIQVDWHENDEHYEVSKMIVEPSGTSALLARSKQKPRWGSYLGILKDKQSGRAIFYDAIGTGKEYRKLVRAISLRFPVPHEDMIFELFAENPQTGVMERVVSRPVYAAQLPRLQQNRDEELEIREIAVASRTPALRVNIYAEGYLKNEKQVFWQHAMKTVQALQKEKFPGVEYMSFYGVFHPSNRKLGNPQNLGIPVPEYDSYLGLYYPYWDNFGRWYHIVYPTREDKFRQGLAAAAYDYPIVLINNSGYWGVGNYMSLTAIPGANTYYFIYLLLHEFGHFFGLNEEYEGGGRTELEFAPGINEPWSQNITFLTEPSYENLKWKSFVDGRTKLPTPDSVWKSSPPVYGAYRGGYADSLSTKGRSHKPGFDCVMESHARFCDICQNAIQQVVKQGLGMNSNPLS
ncbi:M64 family metallopeptidase [Aquicella lusitana]|uniref:IgA peptidase M64 n=1 Tax=Aquicella lusitana TaxID=254246 RepID=A0A370GHU4_9COXI|nr:M64 family metallopeptidase [Aquicella lusitana]RDI43378.1 IgA peptidase M64 [Aquicella lusitana]VVC73528.1 hypothetical protein AQULUS_12710 [Aquicella lusitana]